MATQHTETVLSGDGQRSHLRPAINLSELSGYSTFGHLLATVRNNTGVTQRAVVEAAIPYFRSKNVPVINERIYGDLERGRRAPSFDELEPLYQTLTAGCGISFSAVERELYVKLAQERIQSKRKRIERVSESQWDQLAEILARFDDAKRSSAQILGGEASRAIRRTSTPAGASRRQQAIASALRTDTKHLIERNEWLEQMLSYLTMTPAKKLVTIQAVSGTGKTHALTLLTQRLANMQNYYLIPYKFPSGEDKTPGDHLDIFLATLLTDLEVPQTDETKVRSLDDRIEQVLAEIIVKSEQGVRVVMLLDEAQEILEPTSELSPGWQKFLHAFVKYSHPATIYLATRQWPGWSEREQTYVKETELPHLSPEGSIAIWKQSGFDDVPDDVLRQVSIRCGGNPRMIELRAAHLQRPGFTYAWRRGGEVAARQTRQTKKSENTLRLEMLLEEESIFDLKTDVKVREVLQQVISKRLSHQAIQLLDVLSISPIAMPFPLLDEVCPQAELAFDELVRCSLIDQATISSQRAAAVPLAREARLHELTTGQRKEVVDRQVLHLYEEWLCNLQEFCSDCEKSAVVAELMVLLMEQKQLLRAAELLINFGWLCALFGHLARLQRIYNEVTRRSGWKADPGSEAGGSLLRYQFALLQGQQIDPWERDRAYRKIREDVVAGRVALQPHSEIYLAHYLMLTILRAGHFTEAYQFLDETFKRISKSASISPEEQASFLQSKSYLLGRWSEDKTTKQHPEEIERLRRESVEVLSECTALWKQCRMDALPLQERYINFKLARSLNDCAYYLRLINRLEEAESAIRECIDLKEGGATLPRSLAVSLGEYSQILAALGRLREALSYSDRALQLIDRLINEGDVSASSDKGMLLVERAHVYSQQARLYEAKQLFEEAEPLLVSETRREFRDDAERQLEQLQVRLDRPARHRLDARWYEQYLPLASYDDLQWLSQAGPFLEEEQRLWDDLIDRRHEETTWQRLTDIIVQSRLREFSQSLAERRAPQITYPALDIDDVKTRLAGFEALKAQIEAREKNAVVRRLYIDKIEEHLQILRLVEATYNQDVEGVRKCNELLYGKPTPTEMAIALKEFFGMLKRGQNHPEAGTLCEQLFKQLKQWGIQPEDFLPEREQKSSGQLKLAGTELRRKSFSPATVHSFFEEVIFSDYQFQEWRVVPAPERDNMSLDLDLCELYLPTRTRFSAMKVCELLAEEIETHIFRSVAGKRSPLALLSSGTRGYLVADEGLAIHYVQQMMQVQGFGRKSYSWITTLAPGMVAGVIFPAMNFCTLYDFLRKAFLISNLLAGRFETLSKAEEAAEQDTLARTVRTFRGVPDLTAVGVCSLKDRVYLQGYLEVSKKLEVVEADRLFVGSIGIDQLEDMAELHILKPAVPHRRLALDPDLLNRIAALDDH